VRRVALLIVAACGTDDADLTGNYRVDTAVESEPCGADAPQADPPMFLRFTEDEFFGARFFSMEVCTDAAGTVCTGGGLFGDSFSEPIDDGWRGIVTSSGSGGESDPTCTLFYSSSSALLVNRKLTVESTEYSETVDNTEALCTTDEAQKRNLSMPCIRHEKLEASQL